jgi:hypothetical protein
MIAFQAGVTHWFYLYIAWFLPLVLVALLAPRSVEEPPRARSGIPDSARSLQPVRR